MTSFIVHADISGSENSLASIAPLEAILFDIDGTLCDSDPIHFYTFREMLQEVVSYLLRVGILLWYISVLTHLVNIINKVGFNGGVPITEDFFIKNLSGMHNEEICHALFPDWEIERSRKFLEDKEAMFRRYLLPTSNSFYILCS